MNPTLIIVFAIVVVGVIAMVALTRFTKKREVTQLQSNGEQAQGTVVDVEKDTKTASNGEAPIYLKVSYEVIEFTTADGRTIRGRAAQETKNPRLNQHVTVYYDPANPENFVAP
ncbi:DUF3592 domain-containing protein [Corynebacterium aquatimens]|uniref:DUF3592 domain-containing protein n=1 Tax=Corynebacterium aquatimens TaxID=1190508 RepID=A0A931DZA8_9CORY|nr:DUF3592 domain-containing protein [Corynebacterium aquatimens]MBG6121804.1 hypothetical protein [Corynebacterium aquatimens]WJY65657.1 hypothetical protein CAQUA_04720 [Corynebacterium aquatimens]